ncbi:aldehyde dehydrogenase family protein [Lutimonas zeaxanthinifaciens]|uniref:aldehyde dehydrogenase family protein n=1 Tax=Lutimonas zeaxanthinifaciens TaxID=3060215 RepID=UPI00265C98F4|nr:aldehyde dehydrogenase family protein [Lutimonas sp. YSD2104]WKK65436.1 aldehyde dehydrogenase family protein [Lutimonas sp. YSD2104]
MSRLDIHKTYKLYIGGKFPRTESGRYYPVHNNKSKLIANMCLSSRKDFRNAVVAARKAQTSWAAMTALNKGQILYRIAEMLEGRKEQFVEELRIQGQSSKKAREEVEQSIDRLVYYAGWSDKFQQIFSSVNPVSSAHFNFSCTEPMGVLAVIAPEDQGLLGLISVVAPAILGGNTVVVLASHSNPLSAISFAEVLNSSDVPNGVVNILTGDKNELISHMASHMDVNAIIYSGNDEEEIKNLSELASENLKRIVIYKKQDWSNDKNQSPYFIEKTIEIKTTWHPAKM